MDLTGELAPRKAKIVKSARKVIATVFWDARDIIHIDYHRSKRSMAITIQSYELFQQRFKEKISPLDEEEVFFHQDNARHR